MQPTFRRISIKELFLPLKISGFLMDLNMHTTHRQQVALVIKSFTSVASNNDPVSDELMTDE